MVVAEIKKRDDIDGENINLGGFRMSRAGQQNC